MSIHGWRSLVTVLGLTAGLALFASRMGGQTFYGSIVGTVTDSSGGAISGATVTLTNNGTGERHSAMSGSDGEYRFVNLIPGNYTLDVQQPGFRRYTRDQVAVAVQAAVRADVALELGDVTQAVEVLAAAPLLQTEDATLSQVVGSRSVQELPLNGRNVLNLVALVPGVVPQGLSEGNLTGKNVFAAGNYQIGGGTANQSASYYDGVPVNITYGNIVALVPSQDAVSEFRVQTNNNNAEYGRYTGGVINLASKAGTNDFHGTAYEFLRNRELNSANFFANATGAGKAPFVQNQFGAAAGGPIKKDKAFFFGSYEGYRQRQGVLFLETVPTAQMRTGDFSDYRNSSGAVIPIYDPLSQCGQYNNDPCVPGQPQRQPFQGNYIPPTRVDRVAKKLVGFPEYALPNTAGQPFTHNFNYSTNATTGGDNDQLNLRGDQNVSDKQRLFARFTRWSSANQPVNVYGNGLYNGDPFSPESFVTTQAVLADTYLLSSTKILDVRVAFTRWFYDRTPGTLGTTESSLGFPSYYDQIPTLNGLTPSTTLPGIQISSPTYNSIGTGLLHGRDNTYTLTPTFNWIHGAHNLKFGADLRRLELNYYQNNNAGGVYTFDNLFTSQNALSPGATGNGFASFLLGLPTTGTVQTSPFTAAELRYQSYFAQDTFQASNKLTLTLGLRWEIPGTYLERYDRQATFNPYEPNPAMTGISVNGHPVLGAFDLVNSPQHPDRGLHPEHWHLFAPRLGVAYRLTDKTVIRTGAGIFYIPGNVNFVEGPYSNGLDYYNNTMVTTINKNVTAVNTLSDPFPGGLLQWPGRNPVYQSLLLGANLAGKGMLENIKYGETYQWNFTLQHQFARNVALEVAYAGLRGRHLPQGSYQYDQLPDQYLSLGSQLNQPVTNPFYGTIAVGPLAQPTVQAGQLLLPFPEYQSITDPGSYLGDSTYHALQAKIEKRFGAGGTVLAAYTFSKVLADVESLTGWLDTTLGGNAGYQDFNNRRGEKAISSFDSHQRLTVSYVFDLPFGSGQKFLNSAHGFVNKVVSGWGGDGTNTFQEGFPLGLTATPNLTGFNTGLRPNVASGCNSSISGSAQSRRNQWFNTSCFTVPGAFTFGNESRTDPKLRGPGINNFNFALFKRTALTERFNLEFRAEAFNLFNRVQFGRPNQVETTAPNSTFGVISTQINDPRLLQMAMRLRF